MRAAHYLRVHAVLGTEPGESPPKVRTQNVPIWEAESRDLARADYVTGRSTHDVYARLLALFDSGAAQPPIQNLYCEAESSELSSLLPEAYPDVGTPSRQQWFEGLVDWWQRPTSRLLDFLPFNHGERIRGRRGRYGNQLGRAAKVLEADPEKDTSRAIVVLVDPKEEAGHGSTPFPCFVLAQFKLVSLGYGAFRLDAIAYFRKQEMRYWWPINVAELGRMQRAVLDEFAELDVRPGRLATFSATAWVGKEVPQVAVAEIDRALDTPQRVWEMAAEVAFVRGDQAPRGDWNRVVEELSAEGQRLILPYAGLEALLSQLLALESLSPARVGGVREALQHLAPQVALSRTSTSPEALKREVLKPLVQALERALEQAFSLGPLVTERTGDLPGNPESVAPEDYIESKDGGTDG